MKSRTVALLRERPGERNDRRVLDPYPVPVKFGILPTHRIRQFGAPFASLFGDDADAVDPVAKPMGDYRVTGLVVGNRLFFHAAPFINCPLSSPLSVFLPIFSLVSCSKSNVVQPNKVKF